MKILYLNGADSEGGAAKAAIRLLQGVHAHGADAGLYVQRNTGIDPLVTGPVSLFGTLSSLVRPTIEQLLLGIKPSRMNGPFCAAYLPDGLARLVSAAAPDLLHLHWVARMMRLETLSRFSAPLVWTMHDSWAFTGGCYLPGDCTRYRQSCGKCPLLNSSKEDDLSRRIWLRKKNAWNGLNLTLLAPSRWMADCVMASSLFQNVRVEVIPNGIDTARFQPLDRYSARVMLSLPQDKKLVLFGANGAISDRNKGFPLLVEALKPLSARFGTDRMELVIFGAAEPDRAAELGLRTHYLGWQADETCLAQLYSAADVFVCPSLQETLGYTVMEAMACGTPCVAFKQGGVTDLIDHRRNGYLAQPYQAIDLARGIAWILEDDGRRENLSNLSRHKIESGFSLKTIAEKHLELYRGILNNGR
jgi:glycosyltransferase involved in cell wall biosynthesis